MTTQATVDCAQIPIIDVSALVAGQAAETVANHIRQACCKIGFFYVVGHGIDEGLQQRLEQLSCHLSATLIVI